MAADQRNVPENPAKNFNEYFRFNLGRDTPSDARNTLLVVTTLIIAVTFQAALNPPAGVWQDDRYDPAENCTVVTSDNNDCTIIRYAGTSILHTRTGAGYDIFIFVNTLAFSAATNTIDPLFATGQPFSDRGFTLHLFNELRVWCFSWCCVTSKNNEMGDNCSCFHVTLFLKEVQVAREEEVPQENPAKGFNQYFRYKLGRDPPSDARNTLLVVTTLIVAVTFQAAISPPGGVWQDDKYSPATCTAVTSDSNCTIIRHAGTSVLYYRDKSRYDAFVYANTLAFSAATNTILCLLLDSPFQTEVLLSIYSMNFAFGASVGAVQPPKTMKWAFICLALFLPYIIRMAANQLNIPENPSTNFNQYFRFKLGRDPPSDARNTLLVVTTLIVAVTFQAAINPPGGLWQDDKYSPATCTVVTSDNNCTIIRHAGTSVLYYRNKTGYGIFVFVNTLAFSASTNTIFYLLLDSPFQTEVLLSIYSINAAYGASVAAVQPPKTMKWWLYFVALMLPYISRAFSNFIKRYK
uniref:PGG domain-containing protein n=1 Tax=Salix viminalis TaxID=40686 RepID=A0A6N2MDA4_SALVM